MYTKDGIYIGLSDGQRIVLPLRMCNRHGLITGASGTGKTITMKVLAESFSDAGVPVFLCDVKGDVSGLAQPGVASDGMEKRIDKFGIRDTFSYRAYPVTFWDIYQQQGHPLRVTVSDMGPELLSRILTLTPAQQGVLNIIFRIADDRGLLLNDLADLRAMVQYVGEHRAEFTQSYGNIAAQSIGGITRALLPLEMQGGELFFGEPALDILDWMRTDAEGRGQINLLHCVQLVQNPTMYASFLLWMMSELFERLPEVGDPEKPRLVFFFDEAHLLFTDAPRVLIQKVEQLVKLIRSKGVGIYFVSQSPGDIPGGVQAQLSHRIQHALRAYTPAEQKIVRAAAQSLRANPAFDTQEKIMELGVGEALVSVLDEKGVPGMVQCASILCPQSRMAPADETHVQAAIAADGMQKYDRTINYESAEELLAAQRERDAEQARLDAERAQLEKDKAAFEAQQRKTEEAARKKQEREAEKKQAARNRTAERRKAQIERQLISFGAQALKRGLFGTKWR